MKVISIDFEQIAGWEYNDRKHGPYLYIYLKSGHIIMIKDHYTNLIIRFLPTDNIDRSISINEIKKYINDIKDFYKNLKNNEETL